MGCSAFVGGYSACTQAESSGGVHSVVIQYFGFCDGGHVFIRIISITLLHSERNLAHAVAQLQADGGVGGFGVFLDIHEVGFIQLRQVGVVDVAAGGGQGEVVGISIRSVGFLGEIRLCGVVGVEAVRIAGILPVESSVPFDIRLGVRFGVSLGITVGGIFIVDGYCVVSRLGFGHDSQADLFARRKDRSVASVRYRGTCVSAGLSDAQVEVDRLVEVYRFQVVVVAACGDCRGGCHHRQCDE